MTDDDLADLVWIELWAPDPAPPMDDRARADVKKSLLFARTKLRLELDTLGYRVGEEAKATRLGRFLARILGVR